MENPKKEYLRLAKDEYPKEERGKSSNGRFRQVRGRKLERLIGKALRKSNLMPRLSFRPKGEEIDGSFILDRRVFLLEAKWKAKPVPASDVYSFRGKVEGKFTGTAGLFVSVSGYSPDCIDALRFGKSLNILLVDGSDLESCLGFNNGFRDMVRAKVRHAAETGEPLFPYVSMSVDIRGCDSERSMTEPVPVPTNELLAPGAADIILLVEGENERALVCTLASKILVGQEDCPRLAVIAAQGKRGLASIANVVQRNYKTPEIVIVADADDDREGAEEAITDSLRHSDVTTIIVEPGIEQWGIMALENKGPDRLAGLSSKEILRFVKERGEVRRLFRDDSFRQLFDILLSSRNNE